MLRSSLIAPTGLALLLCACEPQGLKMTETAAPPATPADCAVHVEKTWIDQETPLRRYTSEAATTGPTCEATVATLVIRAREGSPIYTWAGATRDIFGLKDAADPAAMKTALLDWINQDNSNLRTTDQLPPWEETEGQPKRTEFPFHPETWFDAAAWEALRKEKLDLFCFPQGGESLDCAVLRDGQMESIGVQQFPG